MGRGVWGRSWKCAVHRTVVHPPGVRSTVPAAFARQALCFGVGRRPTWPVLAVAAIAIAIAPVAWSSRGHRHAMTTAVPATPAMRRARDGGDGKEACGSREEGSPKIRTPKPARQKPNPTSEVKACGGVELRPFFFL